ncbi:MAG: AAA family ATPase [Cyanobacteria bacterium P01_D01_bin.105]
MANIRMPIEHMPIDHHMSIEHMSVAETPELGYGQLLQILQRRILWLGGAVIGSVGIAAIVTLLQSPTYKSSMQLLVEPNVSSTFTLNSEANRRSNSFPEVQLDYVTQLNLMRSQQFVEQAMALIETKVPELCAGEDSREDCIEEFQDSLNLSQVEEEDTDTRIFEAAFTSDNPLRTQKSLEALKNVYLSYNLEQQKKRLDEGLELVNQQIDEVQANLQQSQQALQQFRQGRNTINPAQQALTTAAASDELSQTQQVVQADYQETLAQYEGLQQALGLEPEQAIMASRLSQSDRYQGLLDALQASELALAERLAVYTESDPVAQDLQAKRDRQVNLLRRESQRLLGTAGSSESSLLAAGQLGQTDLTLVQEMISTRVRLGSLAARQASLAQAEQTLQQKLDSYPSLIAEYDRLQPDVETQRASLEQLLETRQKLSNELAQGGFKWEVVEPPRVGRKIAPVPLQNLALGAIAGLFIGGVLAYGREALDTVVRTSEDLKKQTALPLLGILPAVSEPAGRFTPLTRSLKVDSEDMSSLVSKVQWEPFREAVDLIYKNIQFAASPLNSVMVTSAVAGEGKTTLAVGLALSAARSQQRVLLIDADLRNPELHEQLGLSNIKGLTTSLSSAEVPLPVSVSLAGAQIDILPAGPLSHDPVRLLNSPRMKELIAKLERQYDLIIFDTSAVLGRVDALQVASLCKGVVMVSRIDQITQADLTQATTLLSRVNALGIVANSCNSSPPLYPSMARLTRSLENGAAQNGSVAQLS